MRILFVCNPLYGHLYPLLPLARAAQAAGHEIVMATGADIAPLAGREGLPVWPVGMTHAQGGGNAQASWLDYFEAGARQRIVQLQPRLAAWRPDLVIHEETELAGPVIAVSLGVPSVVHGLGPMPPPRLLPWFRAAIGRLAPVGAAADVCKAWQDSTYLHLCPPGLGVEAAPIWADVLPLRPTTPGTAHDPELGGRIERLPYARSVFLTLGTVYSGNTTALSAALEGLQGQDVNLIVAVGPEGDPAPIESRGRHLLADRLVPLASVLARCCAVVSQGGSGVMLGAMDFGLPQLMLPQGADQFRNAEVGTRAGAALALAPQDATPAAIAHSVQRLLDEPSFTAAAQGLRRQIAVMPGAEMQIAAIAARHRDGCQINATSA